MRRGGLCSREFVFFCAFDEMWDVMFEVFAVGG